MPEEGEIVEVGSLYVRLGLNMAGFVAGMKELEAKIKGIEDKFSGFKTIGDKIAGAGKALTVGLTAPIIAASTVMTKWAMDAVESENLFEVSMGNMAGAARAWSKELSQSLGLNEYETRRNIGTFDVMLKSFGMNEQAAYGMAKGLTQLAYDMASFYNLKPEEAFEKLQSGISGEIEPLRRLGITVSETAVQTYAYTHGIAAQGAELNEQQKVLARYGLIMERTSAAQGDLARTIDSPANQLRVLKSRLEETGITFGQILIPVVLKAATALNHFVQWLQNLSPGAKQTVITLALMVAVLGPLLFAIGKMISMVPDIVDGFALMKDGAEKLGKAFVWLRTNPVGMILAGLSLLVAAGFYVYRNWDGIRTKIIAIWNLLGASAKLVGLEVTYAWKAMQLKVVEIVGKLLDFVAPITRFLPKEWRDAFNDMRDAVSVSANNIRQDVQGLVSKIDGAKGDISKATKAVGKAFTEIKPEVKDSLQDIAGTTSDSATQIGTDIDSIIDAAGNLGDAAKDTSKEWEKAVDAIDLKIKILDNNFQAISASADDSEEANAKLARSLVYLKDKLALVKTQIDKVKKAYDEQVDKTGENSEEALKLKVRLSELQTQEANLTAEIKETSQAISDNTEDQRKLQSSLSATQSKAAETANTFGTGFIGGLAAFQGQVAAAFTAAYGSIQNFSLEASRALVEFFDAVAEGEKTWKDFKSAVKAFLLQMLSALETQVLAQQAAGIATAIAEAPVTFGASLAAIPGIIASAVAALATFELLKAGVRALAEGGTLTSSGAVLVGERGPEILNLPRGARVTPLDKAGAAGTNITINITGNRISSDYDVNRIGDQLVRKLRLAGVYVG